MDSTRTLLHQIAVDRDFAKLENLREPRIWEEWSQEARHALALLFAEYAASSLKGTQVEETFALANSLAPDCPLLAMRRAKMLSLNHKDVGALEQALLAFEQAHKLDPEGSFISWETWGNTLLHLADSPKRKQARQEALRLYEKAVKTTNDPKSLSRLYYNITLCHTLLGEHSEETSELSTALNMLELVDPAHVDYFHIELLHGRILANLSRLLNRPDLSFNALQRLSLNLANVKTPFSLSKGLHCHHLLATHASFLYKNTYNTELFSLAYQNFKDALKIKANCPEIHLEFAQLLLFAVRICQDQAMLEEALACFDKSNIDTEQASPALLDWIDAELIMGSHTDDLQILRSAEKKLMVCLKAQPHDPRVISLYTVLLAELGHYFNNVMHFNTALAFIEEAFTHHPNHPSLWMSSALIYLALSGQTRDLSFTEKACHAYSMVVEHHGEETMDLYDGLGRPLHLSTFTDDLTHLEKSVELFEKALEIGDLCNLAEPIPPLPLSTVSTAMAAAWIVLERSRTRLHTMKRPSPSFLRWLWQITTFHARYNLAVSLAHLGEIAQDLDSLRKASDTFFLLTQRSPENKMAWREPGRVTLIHFIPKF